MDIKKVHILIEQGLQQVGVFAYSDFTHEEVDLAINKMMFSYLEKIFNPPVYNPSKLGNFYETNQEVLDRTRILHEKVILTPSSSDDERAVFNFPSDYFHYIRGVARISPDDLSCSMVYCTELEAGKRYRIMDGSILYKGEVYEKGNMFIAEAGIDYEPFPGEELINIAEVISKPFKVRVHYSSFVGEVLENSLYSTKAYSPVGEINKSSLTVYTNKFLVNSLELVYCKEPKRVDYATQVGLDFPDDVCYEIVDLVVLSLAAASEQPQQKIVNQNSLGNV